MATDKNTIITKLPIQEIQWNFVFVINNNEPIRFLDTNSFGHCIDCYHGAYSQDRAGE